MAFQKNASENANMTRALWGIFAHVAQVSKIQTPCSAIVWMVVICNQVFMARGTRDFGCVAGEQANVVAARGVTVSPTLPISDPGARSAADLMVWERRRCAGRTLAHRVQSIICRYQCINNFHLFLLVCKIPSLAQVKFSLNEWLSYTTHNGHAQRSQSLWVVRTNYQTGG